MLNTGGKEDAFFLTSEYANIEGMQCTPDTKGEYNMCQAIEDMKTDARIEGKLEGKIIARYEDGMSLDDIATKTEQTLDFVKDTLKENGLL